MIVVNKLFHIIKALEVARDALSPPRNDTEKDALDYINLALELATNMKAENTT